MADITVFCFYGKRKSGKDFSAELLRNYLAKFGTCVIRRISDPLKDEYAALRRLDSDSLKTSGPEKEKVREDMVKFGMEIRAKDPGYFCRKAITNLPENTKYLIISDCRRPSDISFFKHDFEKCFIFQVTADLDSRRQRGFEYKPEIDEAETECALDNYNKPNFILCNNGNGNQEQEALRFVIEMFAQQALSGKTGK